ncbi:hypothetical protein KC573_04610 [candidate division WWE3 bacterium]|uniref:Uncharacterized protein n=1 Tax=candidate division WWE3 bacterium TaxID=2053526 RepID=A0A955LWR9_UNCKA|nr:hypothetical protein [candidate division WWE3 bacterium]
MTKEFKEWEKRFSRQDIINERVRWWKEIDENDLTKQIEDRWYIPVSSWTQDAVQDYVYRVSDVEKWQRFRVCLKGLSTHEKLVFLLAYFNVFAFDYTENVYKKEKCRIDNYIGALVRGGQLSSDGQYRILK